MLKKPDWDYWRNLPHAEVWQLVAVSLNLSPRDAGIAEIERFRMSIGLSQYREVKQKFEDRLEIASAHIAAHSLKANINAYYSHCDVRVREFANWAKKLEWSIPPELAAIAESREPETTSVLGQPTSPETPTSKGDAEMLSKKERETLLRMIVSMAIHGFEYDPKKRNSAARLISQHLESDGIPLDEDTVRNWLAEAAKQLPLAPNTWTSGLGHSPHRSRK